jgi:hypothetical protein
VAADLAAFGQKVAAAQGYDPKDSAVDWERYGMAAQYRIGRGKGVPDPSAFRHDEYSTAGKRGTRGARKQPAAHDTVPDGFKPAPIVDSTPSVRIGGFQIRRYTSPPEPNRPHRLNRKGERVTGHYRRRVRRSKRP